MTNKKTNNDKDSGNDCHRDNGNDSGSGDGDDGGGDEGGCCSGWGGAGWALFEELQEGLFVEDGDAEGGGFV
jgi:hypothetical protein